MASFWHSVLFGMAVTIHKKERSSKIQFYQGTRPGSEIKGLSKSLLKELYFCFYFKGTCRLLNFKGPYSMSIVRSITPDSSGMAL